MAVKKNSGKVIGQVEGLKIRQMDKTATVKGKLVTKTSEIGIFRGKNMVETGFKNREVAISRAKEIKSQIVK
jgi:sporulation protein YlmC with PRC-barrel domain